MSSLYILKINPLSVAWFANIFSHSVCCLFILFMVYFVVQKILSLIRSHWFVFVFISITLGDGSKKILLQFMSESVLPILNLFLCIMLENVLISFSCSCPIFSVPCIEESVFSPLYILGSFVIDYLTIGWWVYLRFLYCSIDLYFHFCASTKLFYLLLLCSLIWSQGACFLKIHFSFSRLLWQFRVFCVSIQIKKKIFLF